jgi:hypothetical protein
MNRFIEGILSNQFRAGEGGGGAECKIGSEARLKITGVPRMIL